MICVFCLRFTFPFSFLHAGWHFYGPVHHHQTLYTWTLQYDFIIHRIDLCSSLRFCILKKNYIYMYDDDNQQNKNYNGQVYNYC